MPSSDPTVLKRARDKHRLQNKDVYREYKRQARARKAAYCREVKAISGCVECGEKHPATLEFHHKDQNVKKGDIGQTQWSWDRLKSEIKKCDVLCANCHRKRHWDAEHRIISNRKEA